MTCPFENASDRSDKDCNYLKTKNNTQKWVSETPPESVRRRPKLENPVSDRFGRLSEEIIFQLIENEACPKCPKCPTVFGAPLTLA